MRALLLVLLLTAEPAFAASYDVVEKDIATLQADLDAQNQIIKDKDVEGTKPKKRTDKPSNFVSNRDFNPGSQLRLLSLPEEQNNFYQEVFVREVKDTDDPNAYLGEVEVLVIADVVDSP